MVKKAIIIIFILVFLPVALIGFGIWFNIIYIPRTLHSQIIPIILILITTNGIVAYVILYPFIKEFQWAIKEVINANKKISQGNLLVSLEFNGTSELKELSETYNFMVKTLAISKEIMDDKTDRIEAILESLADAVIAVDNIGRVVMINSAAENLFGVSRKVSGRHLIEVIRNYELYGFIYGCMNTGKPDTTEIKLVSKERLLRVHATPYKDKAGKTLGIVVILRDITELRKLEKMRTEFVANVSHELRTPLTSIKGFVETLLDGAYKDPKISKRFIKIIFDETDRLHRMIDELLDLSQLETNKLKLNMKDVDLKEMIDEIRLIFMKRLEESNIAFSQNIPEALPKVAADPDWLRRIFINLIDNAIKYTPPGGKITVEAEDSDKYIKVQVADTGIGISEEDLPRVFERFYRVDMARSRQVGGAGLGLSIVKHAIKSLGGEITVESKPGKGTKFILTFQKYI